MDYNAWAEEYYSDAEKIKKVMKKYEKKLRGCAGVNLEQLNSTIAAYRSIYYDLLDTAHTLEERARGEYNAA